MLKGVAKQRDSQVSFRYGLIKKTSPVKWNTIITAVELPPVYEPTVAESILQKCLSVCKN